MEIKKVQNAIVRVASDEDAFDFGIYLGFKSISSIGLTGSSTIGREKGKTGELIFNKQRIKFLDIYEYEGNRRSEIIRKLKLKNGIFHIAKASRLAKLPELSLSIYFCPIFEEKPFEDNVRYELFKHIGRKPLYHGYYLNILNPSENPISEYYTEKIIWFSKNYDCGYKFKYFNEPIIEEDK